MRYMRAVLVLLSLSLLAGPVSAVVIQSANGFSSVGTPIGFSAEMTIAGDILTVTLRNDSLASSSAPNDVLSSYYFDIIRGDGARPALAFVGATGDVWRTSKSSQDVLATASANLNAAAVTGAWTFKAMNAASSPFLGFGIGTVGNNNLTPNNFSGSLVDGMDYSIYAGEITTQNLDNKLLVKGVATFRFSGVSGFSEADISPKVVFGMGTAPDSLLPDPATFALLGFSGLALLRRRA